MSEPVCQKSSESRSKVVPESYESRARVVAKSEPKLRQSRSESLKAPPESLRACVSGSRVDSYNWHLVESPPTRPAYEPESLLSARPQSRHHSTSSGVASIVSFSSTIYFFAISSADRELSLSIFGVTITSFLSDIS